MAQKRRKRTKRKSGTGKLLFKMLAMALLTAAVIVAIFPECRKLAARSLFSFRENGKTVQSVPADSLSDVRLPSGISQQKAVYTGYTASFNPSLRIPNFVVYELTGTEAEGTGERARHFLQDTAIENCPEPSDYTKSGFDRGHMAPAADMKWSGQAMRESFYMTNICPQNHALNSGGWKRLEEKVRDWAIRDSALVVITGPIVQSRPKRLDSGVAIPDGFFKVLLAPYATPMRGIAFIYKNEGGQKKIEMQAVSIDSVEAATGFDFFHALPDEIENRIEKSYSYQEWNN